MPELFSAHKGEAITSASLTLLGEEGRGMELHQLRASFCYCDQHLQSSAGDSVPRAAPLLPNLVLLFLL